MAQELHNSISSFEVGELELVKGEQSKRSKCDGPMEGRVEKLADTSTTKSPRSPRRKDRKSSTLVQHKKIAKEVSEGTRNLEKLLQTNYGSLKEMKVDSPCDETGPSPSQKYRHSSQRSLDFGDLEPERKGPSRSYSTGALYVSRKEESVPVVKTLLPSPGDIGEDVFIHCSNTSLNGSMNLNDLDDYNLERNDDAPKRRPPKRRESTGTLAKKLEEQLIPSLRPSSKVSNGKHRCRR
jgi:hypothetical protein